MLDLDHILNPYERRSACGRWTLRIDPSTRRGTGPAHYRMSHDGTTVWQGDLQDTLSECAVASNGTVVGYGYDDGLTSTCGSMIVMVIAPDGRILSRDPRERDTICGITPNPRGSPEGLGVVLDEDGDRAIVRIFPHPYATPFLGWVYRLSDGKTLDPIPRLPLPGENERWGQVDVFLIQHTELLAVHAKIELNAGFGLIDRTNTLVWSRVIEQDYPPKLYPWSLRLAEAKFLSVGPSTFSITSYKHHTRTHFQVSKTTDDEWSVVELRAEEVPPISLDPPPGPRLLAVSTGRMRQIGEVQLSLPGGTDSPPMKLVGMEMDHAGAMYVPVWPGSLTYVLDPSGHALRVLTPNPQDIPHRRDSVEVRVEQDGSVLTNHTRQGAIVIYDPRGVRVAAKTLAPDQCLISFGWCDVAITAPPRTSARWQREEDAVRFLEEDKSVTRTIRHRPNGDWLVTVIDAASAPDGSLAVLSEDRAMGEGWLFQDPEVAYLCIYDADGSPRMMTPLALESLWTHLRFDGRRAFLTSEKGVTVVTVPAAPDEAWHAIRYPKPEGAEYPKCFPRPDGTIAVWDHGARTVQIFALDP